MAYQHDLAECQGYADQVNVGQEAMGTGLLTAATGAALGAIAGAFGGGAGHGAAIGASLGGVSGGVGGGVNAYDRRAGVLRQCLANRGYAVLD
ncbi:MAG: glycine zipper family protein [Rhodospirillaceae bacterium]|nr:glycine zipper family protein [Rhodospirillaceae bacterium]